MEYFPALSWSKPFSWTNLILPPSNTHIAWLLSLMGSLMKFPTSCCIQIQRTLHSDKNGPRYSSFSVISLVKLPILRAWPIFEHFKSLKLKKSKHDNVWNKIQTLKSETARLEEDAPRKSVLISSIEKVSIFLWNKLEKYPQFRQFTCQNALFHKTQSVVLSWFLVEPLPVLVSRIPIKIENEMNITNFWIRNMARILPSENYVKQKFFLAKMPFYPSNCREVCLVLSPIRCLCSSDLQFVIISDICDGQKISQFRIWNPRKKERNLWFGLFLPEWTF